MATESIPPLKKTCTKCGREFPATAEFFHQSKTGKYGLQSQCKGCLREKAIHYRAEHIEELHSREAAWRSNHRAEITQRRAERKEYYRQWRAEHKERVRTLNASYYAEHRASLAAYAASYREQHKAEISAKRRSPRGKEASKRHSHLRRARQLQSGGSYTPAELEAVLKAHTNKKGQLICAFCGKPIKGRYHIDHWIPLRHGGGNDAGNLRVMHPKCNQKKHAKHPQIIGRLI